MGVMTTLVMNYTINPIWAFLKKTGNALIDSRIRHGRAVAASHLAAMGYYEEAKKIMLEDE